MKEKAPYGADADPVEKPVYAPVANGWRVRVSGEGEAARFSFVEVDRGCARPFLLKGLPEPRVQLLDARSKRRAAS